MKTMTKKLLILMLAMIGVMAVMIGCSGSDESKKEADQELVSKLRTAILMSSQDPECLGDPQDPSYIGSISNQELNITILDETDNSFTKSVRSVMGGSMSSVQDQLQSEDAKGNNIMFKMTSSDITVWVEGTDIKADYKSN